VNAFRIGDRVRVVESLSSEFAGQYGVVVALEQRQSGTRSLPEFELQFSNGVRRRFFAFQLELSQFDDSRKTL